MGAQEARSWLAVWHREHQLSRRSSLPRGATGPGTRRPRLGSAFATARRLFPRTGARPSRLLDDAGAWRTGPEELDDLLWKSRAAIWGACPALPAGASAVLDLYFHGRFAAFPAAPDPRLGDLTALILAPSGAAPGPDNEP